MSVSEQFFLTTTPLMYNTEHMCWPCSLYGCWALISCWGIKLLKEDKLMLGTGHGILLTTFWSRKHNGGRHFTPACTVCIYVCLYLWMCVHMWLCIFKYGYIWTYKRAYTNKCLYACMYGYMFACWYICLFVCMYSRCDCMHAYMFVCIRLYVFLV